MLANKASNSCVCIASKGPLNRIVLMSCHASQGTKVSEATVVKNAAKAVFALAH